MWPLALSNVVAVVTTCSSHVQYHIVALTSQKVLLYMSNCKVVETKDSISTFAVLRVIFVGGISLYVPNL